MNFTMLRPKAIRIHQRVVAEVEAAVARVRARLKTDKGTGVH